MSASVTITTLARSSNRSDQPDCHGDYLYQCDVELDSVNFERRSCRIQYHPERDQGRHFNQHELYGTGLSPSTSYSYTVSAYDASETHPMPVRRSRDDPRIPRQPFHRV